MEKVTVRRWMGEPNPTQRDVDQAVAAEGRPCYSWGNAPGDRYAMHTHAFHKVLYCLRGSISFTLPASGETVELFAGDRMELPAGTPHSAVVGPAGVLCCETHIAAQTIPTFDP